MKIGSLFSGIGGLELGLERAIPNSKTVWQVEKDPYARAVLAKHWPEAKRYNDVEKVGAHNLEPIDICVGGFPCQDLSIAGKRAGIDGARSGLWREFARIIGELRPRFVIVENVPTLRLRGMDRVLGNLAAFGYDAVWDCIPAQAVGANHRRDRLFIVATMAHADSERQLQQKGTIKNKWGRLSNGGPKMADPNGARLQGHRPTRDARQVCPQKTVGLFSRSLGYVQAWEPEPGLGRVANGIPNRVDRLRCLGNAVVPQVAEIIGRVVVDLSRLE